MTTSLPFSALLFATTAVAVAVPAQTRPIFLAPTQMPAPTNVAGTSSYSMAISADGLTALVETDRPGGVGGRDIIRLARPTVQSSFTSYGPMGFCTAYDERGGSFSDVVYHEYGFASNRPGGAGGLDLYMANGSGLTSLLVPLNSPWDDTDPCITSDGLEFFFTSNRPGSLGGRSIWRATRASINDPWGSPIALTSIDSANHEQSPSLSDDGLTLFFSSNRTGNFDIHAATRSSLQAPFGAPVRVAELSGPYHDIGIDLAPADAQALVTVMVDGRAVIMAAPRDLAPEGTPQLELSAAETVAPGEVLSVLLESPAGHLGVLVLGAPIAPVPTPFGLLALDPAGAFVFDVFLQGSEMAHLSQVVLPAAPQLHGAVFALQALGGLQDLQLSNAILRTVL